MRVQTKLSISIFLIIIVFIIAFVIQLGFEQKRLNSLFDDRKNEEMAIFDKILDLKGESLKTLAYDYTYWDEMVNFIVKGDTAWAEATIDTSVLSNYHAKAIWIYKTDLSLAYSINSLKDSNLKDIPLPKETINTLFSKERFCHFFMNTSWGLMEIRGATIHPTGDVERKTKAQGYFFACRLWDNDYISELSATTRSTIVITPVTNTKKDSVNNDHFKKGVIAFSKILTGWDKIPLVRLNVNIKAESIKYSYRLSKQQLFSSLIFAIIILAFILLSIMRWVAFPLQSINRTLNTENTAYLYNLQKDNTEFGDISRLIDKFFNQKEKLIEEVNERKQAEEELKNSYDKLKYAQAQLIQASKMSSVGSLASGVAHEINNPLTGVLNNVQLIKMSIAENKGFNADDFKELLDSMEDSAQRCVNITRTLLDFSRPSKGIFQNISIRELIGKVLILIRHELEMGNIKIQRDIESNLPEVKGDPQLLQQAIFDIVSNAQWAIQKKSAEEGGLITIKACYESNKDTVDISISDTGIGISEENLKRVFEPFFTTKGVDEGIGLGLYMVYNIIKEHKGKIEVESQLNQGATFKISLLVA